MDRALARAAVDEFFHRRGHSGGGGGGGGPWWGADDEGEEGLEERTSDGVLGGGAGGPRPGELSQQLVEAARRHLRPMERLPQETQTCVRACRLHDGAVCRAS